MSDMTVSANIQTPQKKKLSPAAKGAIVGGGIQAGFASLGFLSMKAIYKDEFTSSIKQNFGGYGKYGAIIASGIAMMAAVGAGINVFRHRNDDIDAMIAQKEQKEQEAKAAQ